MFMIRANEIVSRRNEKKTSEGRKVMLVPLKSEKRPKGEPMYRDPDNPFNTWTGIGKRPAWLTAKLDAGISLEAMKMQGVFYCESSENRRPCPCIIAQLAL